MIKFAKTWWPTMLTVAVVLYATLWPDPVGAPEAMWFPEMDKLLHAIMMGGILSAVLFDRRRSRHLLTAGYIASAAIAVAIFSVGDEFGQHVLALGRTFSFGDMFANFGGIVLASLLAPPVINRIYRNRLALNA